MKEGRLWGEGEWWSRSGGKGEGGKGEGEKGG